MQRVGEPPSHDAGCDAVTLLSYENARSVLTRAHTLLEPETTP